MRVLPKIRLHFHIRESTIDSRHYILGIRVSLSLFPGNFQFTDSLHLQYQ
jgi:hypothetical protein